MAPRRLSPTPSTSTGIPLAPTRMCAHMPSTCLPLPRQVTLPILRHGTRSWWSSWHAMYNVHVQACSNRNTATRNPAHHVVMILAYIAKKLLSQQLIRHLGETISLGMSNVLCYHVTWHVYFLFKLTHVMISADSDAPMIEHTSSQPVTDLGQGVQQPPSPTPTPPEATKAPGKIQKIIGDLADLHKDAFGFQSLQATDSFDSVLPVQAEQGSEGASVSGLSGAPLT